MLKTTLYLSALLAPLCLCLATAVRAQDAADDPYLWLEDVEGARAMAWVKERNAATLAELEARPEFGALRSRLAEILGSRERIAMPSIMGDYLYNFWQDAEHPRGLWRRTTWAEYRTEAPAWETVLDLDVLGQAEGVPWAFKGANCLPPQYRSCLVGLSRGGADAVQLREFDLADKQFVEGGFRTPEAKQSAAWIDQNTLLLASDFGEGSMTTSGYARTVRRWSRGEAPGAGPVLFEALPADMGVWVGSLWTEGRIVPYVTHRPGFFEAYHYLVGPGGDLSKLDLPNDAEWTLLQGQLVVRLRTPWEVGGQTLPAGAVAAVDWQAYQGGGRAFEIVARSEGDRIVEGFATTADHLLVSVLNNVRGELYRYRREEGAWRAERVPAPDLGSVGIVSTDEETNRFFFTYGSYLQPTSLYLSENGGDVALVKQLPALFSAEGLVTEQHEAVSKDGTRIPFFIVHRKGLRHEGANPTLLYGYGGFEISMTPGYSAVAGAAWLERGGVWVVANIRGGGEFGPAWHRAALKENRQRAYDDFLAVAEYLIAQKVTSARHLGIMGGSNGGLLVGNALTQRPDLFGAVVSTVPLLDMRRYTKLLAGASWMAEYGDPDKPEEWAYIQRYSPYHNLKPGVRYPPALFYTTTRDDRVHPGHARKMAARMLEMQQPVRYFENTEGGHGAGVTPEQQATMWAVIYTFLWDRLG